MAPRTRSQGVPFSMVIPTLVTLGAMCAAMTGIRYAMDELWTQAVAMVCLAAVLDGLDGRVARLLNAKSDFGAELDSLADVVSFGVAPAFILWSWSLSVVEPFGWFAALLFPSCIALRLARFNTMLGKAPHYAYNFFSGIPAPAAALLSLMPVIWSFDLGQNVPWLQNPDVVGLWIICVGGLAISTVPTWSFKKMQTPKPVVLCLAVVFVGVIALAMSRPWAVLSGIGIVYLATFPLSAWQYAVLRKKAEELKADGLKAESTTSPDSDTHPSDNQGTS